MTYKGLIDNTAKTRDFFLKCIAAVYMFAFGSIYTQIPGLYGKSGVLPVSTLLQSVKDEVKSKTAESLFMNTPTLLWFMPIEPDIGMEILALLGITLSFFCLLWRRIRAFPTFLALWLLYLSIYKVGETFMWFQWDILLLEVGAITILVAPVSNKFTDVATGASLHRQIPFFLVRWLLFRLMFASGVVKLTSKCPTWWGLTALNYHYESQCIPTPLSWWAHQLPDYVQQFSVIATYVIEIGLPFIFFLPFRFPRLVAAYGQVILMIAIYLSGNYNFFNILTVILCLSLIDDRHLAYFKYCVTLGYFRLLDPPGLKRPAERRIVRLVKFFLNLSIFSCFIYAITLLFGYKNGKFRIKFTQSNLQSYLSWIMPYLIWMAVVSFVITSLGVLYKILNVKKKRPITSLLKFLIMLGTSAYLLTISVEYHFLYKPGNLKGSLPWAAPHQARLDWQMWFAALGNYQHNPWILSLAQRILTGQPEVLDLMDRSANPFPDKPPKYLRMQLYHYHFTKLTKDLSVPKATWRRKLKSTYVPIITKDDTKVMEFLKYNKLLPKPVPKKKPVPGRAEVLTSKVRSLTETMSPPVLLWSLLLTAWAVNFFKTCFRYGGK